MKTLVPHAVALATLVLGLAVNLPLTGCTPSATSEGTDEYIDDAAMSTKVRAKILADSDVKISDIKVTTYRGTVQLGGYVENEQMAAKAVEDAKSITGVRDVKNHLVIRQ